ncbi:MAG TPA: hypothetical protein VNE41_04965 [Chitinophagaceae bacterium]|nr:hypothetical protein [Chitinophagaceae bacterium]
MPAMFRIIFHQYLPEGIIWTLIFEFFLYLPGMFMGSDFKADFPRVHMEKPAWRDELGAELKLAGI